MSDRPRWRHKRGDEYVVIFAEIVGNERDGFETVHWLATPKRFIERTNAISTGLKLRDSDDFNIGAIRGGRLAATLWMSEIVDDGPVLMARISEEVGL